MIYKFINIQPFITLCMINLIILSLDISIRFTSNSTVTNNQILIHGLKFGNEEQFGTTKKENFLPLISYQNQNYTM